MHTLTDRQQAKLLTVVADAKDATEQTMDAIRAAHQPAIDDLRAQAKAKRQEAETADDPDALKAEAEALDEQAAEYAGKVTRRRDLERQIGLVEAVQAVDAEADEPFAMDAMFADLEIRARHDLPGSQYVARTLTEQAKIEAGDALDRGLDRLRAERDALDQWLAG